MTVRTAGGLFALTVLAYTLVVVWFSPLPLQDFPNHLARAYVLADLLFQHGAEFGDRFQFHFLFAPYVGGDLALATLVRVIGVNGAAAIWAALTLLSLPLSVYVYLRAVKASPEVVILMLFTSLYLSTDTFFLMGFFEFRLSIALVLLCLAMIELLRERWSLVYFAIYVALVVITYLVHLAPLAFIGMAQGASALWRLIQRRSSFAREVVIVTPVICVLAWHFVAAVAFRQPDDLVVGLSKWGTVEEKLSRVSWDFRHYARRQDDSVIATFLIFLSFCLLNRRVEDKTEWRRREVVEPLGYTLLFLALYWMLPLAQVEATYIDVRALTMVPLFLLLGLLNIRTASAATTPVDPVAVSLVAVVAWANLSDLSFHFWRDSQWLAQYRTVVDKIPARATILPIYTERKPITPLRRLHVASFALIDRQALIPYLFSGDRGHPMKYFRYVNRPYAPDEVWYQAQWDQQVDWGEVARQYRYLLVMKPFAVDRIPVHTRTIAESEAAALQIIEDPARQSEAKRAGSP